MFKLRLTNRELLVTITHCLKTNMSLEFITHDLFCLRFRIILTSYYDMSKTIFRDVIAIPEGKLSSRTTSYTFLLLICLLISDRLSTTTPND